PRPGASRKARPDDLCRKLPGSLPELREALAKVQPYREYDAAANRASAHVWLALGHIDALAPPAVRLALLNFAADHMAPEAQARVCRRLVKDPDPRVRRRARRLVEQAHFREVALPRTADGPWDATGWLRGTDVGPLLRHPQGRRVLERHGLPEIANLGALRTLLGIRSPRQLGFFLLASDR